MIYSCTHQVSPDPKNWNENELREWFQTGEWKSGWEVCPDESVNPKELAKQFYKNKERWKKAFDFLHDNDLKNISVGRYELEGNDLYVMVQNYTTKNEENTSFEAHRNYADIQYIIEGKEKIGVITHENTKEITSYDSLKDIVLLASVQNNYRVATPSVFFVFFSEDVHRPCVKVNENIQIKKVVVKVRIN